MRSKVNKGLDLTSSAWNYREGRLIVLSKGKYLLMGNGSIDEESDITKIGKINRWKELEFFLWNNDRRPSLNPCHS